MIVYALRNSKESVILQLFKFCSNWDINDVQWKMRCVKSVYIQSFFGSYFSLFGQNTEIYKVNQFEYGKILTTKNSVFGQFLRSDTYLRFWTKCIQEFLKFFEIVPRSLPFLGITADWCKFICVGLILSWILYNFFHQYLQRLMQINSLLLSNNVF